MEGSLFQISRLTVHEPCRDVLPRIQADRQIGPTGFIVKVSRLVLIGCLGLAYGFGLSANAQLMLSGNENKIDLTSGGPRLVSNVPPDSISILDFSKFPPSVRHLTNIANTVIGPPSNIAITPDGSLALIADSIKLDPRNSTNWLPNTLIHVLDLKTSAILYSVPADLQPSGLSISRSGRLALVANRAAGTISVLTIDGTTVKNIGNVKVCEPLESISDVAISPDGKFALASVQKGGYLAVLQIDGTQVKPTGRKISVYGQPYRCVITPDGKLGLTAGQGFGNGVDMDALSVIDLTGAAPRTIDHVALGAVPESIEISPDGRLLVAVVMDGSNLAPSDPNHTKAGALVILERRGRSFAQSQRLPVGRIPEGVAFTSDGRSLVVQCHPDRNLWVFSVKNGRVKDSGHRIAVPGMPSSLRASPAR
jgi:DNA-binding beta-propeller fold protein YncE